MSFPQPSVGEWYRVSGGDIFEVVAVDEDDRTIEIQYFDGTVEELDADDWEAQCEDGQLELAEPPEDWSGSVDVEPEPDTTTRADPNDRDRQAGSGSLDGLDIFEAR